jgi:release factor glutamine methyltransferase
MTYREMRMKTAGMLHEAGIENEAAESWFLMEFACGIDRSFYFLHEADEMSPEDEQKLSELAQRRCSHIPLQHLTGEQEFMGLPFWVNEHVLIPRQDTEILVEEALKKIPKADAKKGPYRVLDLCTGSGCIAISIASFCPHTEVSACDISREALLVAQRNGQRNGVSVQFVQSDLFSQIHEKYDMIVSNPPYIPSAVIPTLMPEVRDFEPKGALDGMEDGLFFYRKIVRESLDYLMPHGELLFEIGHDQAQAVSDLMRENNFYDIKVIKDLAGLDRVVTGRRFQNV